MRLVACPACRRSISSSAPSCPHCGHPLTPQLPLAAASRLSGPPLEEQVLWQGSPSVAALLASIIGTALFAIVVPLVAFAGFAPLVKLLGSISPELRAALVKNFSKLEVGVIIAVAVLVGLRVLGLVWRILVLKSHRYRVSNQRLTIETGLFSKHLEELDMRNVEDILFRQSFLERLLGIGQIAVISADKSAARVQLHGVANPREVRELIRDSAYQATRGQLFTRTT
jgi:uncharacterized membrane protein YdbT with pleckstrin-like domain